MLPCVDCGEPVKHGTTCGHCEAEIASAVAAGIVPGRTPPYARCASDGTDPKLPDNAGRYKAPDAT